MPPQKRLPQRMRSCGGAGQQFEQFGLGDEVFVSAFFWGVFGGVCFFCFCLNLEDFGDFLFGFGGFEIFFVWIRVILGIWMRFFWEGLGDLGSCGEVLGGVKVAGSLTKRAGLLCFGRPPLSAALSHVGPKSESRRNAMIPSSPWDPQRCSHTRCDKNSLVQSGTVGLATRVSLVFVGFGPLKPYCLTITFPKWT